MTVANALDRMAGGADDNSAQGNHLVPTGRTARTLTAQVLRAGNGRAPDELDYWPSVSHTLTAGGSDASEDRSGRGTPMATHANGASHIRRLTSLECGRLQGFPDDWFGAPNAPPDSPRMQSIGDAVTVNVAAWVGERIITDLEASA